MANLAQVLFNSLNHVKEIREEATQQLESACKSNFSAFVDMLVVELVKEDNDVQIRMAAGLAAKNALTSKNNQTRAEKQKQWVETDPTIKQRVKNNLLVVLGSNEQKCGGTAAQVIAAIAAVDLAIGQWEDLIMYLLNAVTSPPTNVANPTNMKRSALETIGYICDEADPSEPSKDYFRVLTTKANPILTAVVSGARKEEPDNNVRLAAVTALFNSLDFIRENFNMEGERNYIMQVVCEATQSDHPPIQVAAFECLVRIMSLYYDHMFHYMEKALFALTFDAMSSQKDGVALQAVEFWSTVCDEEIDLNMEVAEGELHDRTNHNFALVALPHIVPVLTRLLIKEDDDDDDDEWNINMAAGTCLSLLATCVENAIVEPVLPFVQQNIVAPDWRQREAAIMAFGSIMEGPSAEALQGWVAQALGVLIEAMKDASPAVQDTTAWTLGRVCELMFDAIDLNRHLPALIEALLTGLAGPPRIASHCAWALMNLSEQAGDEGCDMPTYALSPFYQNIISTLLVASERQDGEESNLRTSVYESLMHMVQNTTVDTFPIVMNLADVVLDRLEKMGHREADGSIRFVDTNETQANLCAVLQNIVRKLGDGSKAYADRMMTTFMAIFQSSTSQKSTISEDALMAVGTLTAVMGKEFSRYMESFMPYLNAALSNNAEHMVCSIAVGLVGDICRALEEDVVKYCDTFMHLLLTNLQTPALHQNVKPPILSSFGDIAIAIGPHFEKYLAPVMSVLRQACELRANPDDYDMIEYVNQLHEGILEAYVSIVTGMKNLQTLGPYLEPMIGFVGTISQDPERTDSVSRLAVGLLGDIAELGTGGSVFTQHMNWIQLFIRSCKQSKNEQTKIIASWTRDVLNKLS